MTAIDTTATRCLDMSVSATRDADGQATGRTFTGIGVPYGQTINLGFGVLERFEPGAIDLDRDDVPTLILWRHSEPIGRVDLGRDTEAGYEITGILSDTPRGREAATLLRDGVITRMSIGFVPEAWRLEEDDEHGTTTIVHTKVRALEFSLVPFPAYSNAAVTSVRHDTTHKEYTMPTTAETLTRADLDPLEISLQDTERRLSLLETTATEAVRAPRFRSAGAYLKAVASGDEDALAFHRDFSGQTTTGSLHSETYLGEFIKRVQDRRRLINLFDSGALPAKGMSVEYAVLTSDTHTAGKQATEGANLPGPGKITLGTRSAKIDTYGGWTELTRQFIERSELPYLDTVMTSLGMAYAKATNTALRTEIKAAITAQDSNALTLSDNSVYGWRDAIVDAAARFDEAGFTLDGLLVSTDVYKKLQRLEYTNVPAMTVRAGDEFTGTLSLPSGNGDLARVPVYCMYGEADENTAAFFDSSAVKTLESAGAPLQLQDDNIINLSKAFSLYGYLAVIVPFPTAIIPVKAHS